jgi:hypothetical protein
MCRFCAAPFVVGVEAGPGPPNGVDLGKRLL